MALSCGHRRDDDRRAAAVELWEADWCPVCPGQRTVAGANPVVQFKTCGCCGDSYTRPDADGTLRRFMTI